MTGFQDGILRFLKVALKNQTTNDSFTKSMLLNDSPYELILFEVFKPHTKAITSIAIDSKNSIIATAVSFKLFNWGSNIFYINL